MKRILIIAILLISKLSFGHEFFISIADMEYDSTKNRINVSLKMTAHDFEWVMEHKFQKKMTLENVADSSAENKFIQQYLFQNFKLYTKDEELVMNYLGFEVNSRDEMLCYFFFTGGTDYTTIKIINKLLFSISDLQQNIVHYKCKGRTKSVTLIPSKSEAWITIYEDEQD